MELRDYKQNEKIFTKGTPVSSIGILISGAVKMVEGKNGMTIRNGSFIGISEYPGDTCRFDYVAAENSKVAIYDYTDLTDIKKILQANSKIMPIICSQTVTMANESYKVFEGIRDMAEKEYQKIQSDYADYPSMMQTLGQRAMPFPEIDNLEEPPEPVSMQTWMIDMLRSMKDNEETFQKQIYVNNIDMVNGFIMGAALFVRFEYEEGQRLRTYIKAIKQIATDFYTEYKKIDEKLADLRGTENEDEADNEEMPDMSDALSNIIKYAGLEGGGPAEKFEAHIEEYKGYSDRSDMGDAMRRLRRTITDGFFDLYQAVFMEYLKAPENAPAIVKMFLTFGFIDEELAGEENTKLLYSILKKRKPDPSGVVVTIPEWLMMIYEGKVMPSKNEFDLDYPSYLREQRQNGEITADLEKKLIKDMSERVKFEIHNMFKVGDRMTFGRISSFIPIFDEVNVMRPLDRAYLTNAYLHEKLDEHRNIDYTCFYHPRDYNNEELEIAHLNIDIEVLPYFILMPNYGVRVALWQEIEGKRRDTPARFILPIFTAEDPGKSMIGAFGEYRWEMCKTEQGAHWNDITEPSLTSEYADFIQYYRKNRNLNPDQKEKIKKLLQKVQNNLRRAFVYDYTLFILSESNGSPVMNKEARRILFTYAPFSAPIRAKIGSNPQYAENLNRFNNQIAGKARPLENITKKLVAHGIEVPQELMEQKRFLEM